MAKKWRCSVCGYIYDPEIGDPDGGIAAGTAFEAIPDDWVCPECGVSKDEFEPLDEQVTPRGIFTTRIYALVDPR